MYKISLENVMKKIQISRDNETMSKLLMKSNLEPIVLHVFYISKNFPHILKALLEKYICIFKLNSCI